MPRVTVQVPEKNPQPYRFNLDRQGVTLGRGDENDIFIDCGSVSVSHAEMRRVLGGYELVDLGSTNGIKLDGVRQEVIPLYTGADVKLGEVEFGFLLTDEELVALSREQGHTQETAPAPIAPQQQKNFPPKRGIYQERKSSALTFGAILFFLILAACAFFAGLALRHQKETGKSLIEAIQVKYLGDRKALPPRAIPVAEPVPTP